jgi:hypothetical protein
MSDHKVGCSPLTSRIESLRRIVCDYYGITEKRLCSPLRNRPLVIARHMFWHIARELAPALSLQTLARLGGRANHTSVMHGIAKMNSDLILYDNLREDRDCIMALAAAGQMQSDCLSMGVSLKDLGLNTAVCIAGLRVPASKRPEFNYHHWVWKTLSKNS